MDSVGQKLLDVARKELGYSENSSGYTKYGDWYAKHVASGDSYYSTAPWCDMFLAWAADKAGVQASTGEFAATVDHAKWFKQHNAFGTTPEPGAIVFFSWSGSNSLDDIEHVGLVESVDGSTLHTIEGNTTGGNLMRKTRDVSQVVGYGYPGKVKVAAPVTTAAAAPSQGVSVQVPYAPRHSAPAPTPDVFLRDTAVAYHSSAAETAHHAAKPHVDPQSGNPLGGHEAVLSSVMAVLLCSSLALAVGKATAKKVPTPTVPEVRVRKRGKHHRTGTPVELPAEVTVAEFEEVSDFAEAGTMVMPALTAEAAQLAEDQVFWGKISEIADDEELSFWNDLHDAVAQTGLGRTSSVDEALTPAH